MRWNSSLFFYDYQDIILALTLTDTGELGLDTFLINENGANADVSGLESEIWWAPSDYLDIKLGATWLNTEQESIPTSPFKVSELLDGSELPYAPGFSANGLIRYERPVSTGWLGFAQFDFTARSDYFGEATNAPLTLLEGYTLYNVRLGVEPQDGAWSVNVWAKNLADEGYSQYVNDLSSLGSILTTPGLPRTYGLDFSLRFLRPPAAFRCLTQWSWSARHPPVLKRAMPIAPYPASTSPTPRSGWPGRRFSGFPRRNSTRGERWPRSCRCWPAGASPRSSCARTSAEFRPRGNGWPETATRSVRV